MVVTVSGVSGAVVRKASVRKLTADGPEPIACSPPAGSDDKAREDKPSPETAILRLTVAREYHDAEVFQKLSDKPRGLVAAALGDSASRVIQSFAFAAYDNEVTCLLRVRKSDTKQLLTASRGPGVFLAPHREAKPTVAVQWLERSPKLESSAYLQSALSKVAASAGAILAYRPGGKANLGVRYLDGELQADASKPATGVIAPRFSLTGTLSTWLLEDVLAWLKERGFKQTSHVQRTGATTWFFRGWPPSNSDANASASPGALIFASGIVVAPASAGPQRKQRTPPATIAGPMWDAPAPAKREPNPKTKPAATVTGRSEPQDAEMSNKPERERSRSPKGQGGPGNTESCDQPELDIPTPMPHSDLFEAVECGGGGDCAFLSIAQCLAAAGNKPTAADLAPGGKLQAYLRCKASKYMREHASDFSHISEASTLTDEIAKPGTWANSVSLTALALELKLQLRIWAWDKALRKWNRGTFISLVRPRLDPPRKKAKRPMAMRCPLTQTWFGCDCMISTTSGCGQQSPLH